jgi:hypothetical protein
MITYYNYLVIVLRFSHRTLWNRKGKRKGVSEIGGSNDLQNINPLKQKCILDYIEFIIRNYLSLKCKIHLSTPTSGISLPFPNDQNLLLLLREQPLIRRTSPRHLELLICPTYQNSLLRLFPLPLIPPLFCSRDI